VGDRASFTHKCFYTIVSLLAQKKFYDPLIKHYKEYYLYFIEYHRVVALITKSNPKNVFILHFFRQKGLKAAITARAL
jgi:hypothetical protein